MNSKLRTTMVIAIMSLFLFGSVVIAAPTYEERYNALTQVQQAAVDGIIAKQKADGHALTNAMKNKDSGCLH